MGGVFGGVLAVNQELGGLLLFLLIGSKAWKATNNGEHLRSLFRGAALGLLIGIAICIFAMTERDKIAFPPEAMIAVCTVGGIILAVVLYGLHRMLK